MVTSRQPRPSSGPTTVATAAGPPPGHLVGGRKSHKEEKLERLVMFMPVILGIAGLGNEDYVELSEEAISAAMDRRLKLILMASKKLDIIRKEI